MSTFLNAPIANATGAVIDLTAYSPPAGGPFAYPPGQPSVFQVGTDGLAYFNPSTGGSRGLVTAAGVPDSPDCTVSAGFTLNYPQAANGDQYALCLRANPTGTGNYFGTYYCALFAVSSNPSNTTTAGQWSIYLFNGSAYTGLGTSAAGLVYTNGAPIPVSFSATGTALSVSVSGAVVASGTDATLAAAGLAGLFSQAGVSGGCKWSNLVGTTPTAPPPPPPPPATTSARPAKWFPPRRHRP